MEHLGAAIANWSPHELIHARQQNMCRSGRKVRLDLEN
jgi:hypothetical protein